MPTSSRSARWGRRCNRCFRALPTILRGGPRPPVLAGWRSECQPVPPVGKVRFGSVADVEGMWATVSFGPITDKGGHTATERARLASASSRWVPHPLRQHRLRSVPEELAQWPVYLGIPLWNARAPIAG